MKKVLLISLGCAKNLVDSERILGILENDDYVIVNKFEECDIVIINTCGFIESSKRESLDTILSFINKGKKVVVTGCLVERYKEELEKEIPEVDLYIPIREYDSFNQHFKKVDPDLNYKGVLGLQDDLRLVSTEPFTAYLLIGDGCDNRCTYCAIPLIRGGYKSRPFESIIKEAKHLVKEGRKELVILQQDTTKYGIDLKDVNIVTLLKELLKIEGLEYIRLLYLYPDEISDELIDLMGKEKRLTPYFDIPIQHSESHILKRMNRRGDKEFLLNLFKKIRKKVPNAILRTTLLVGFPGEKEEDIDHLIEFIKEVKFDHIGAFTYSKEEGTASFNYPDQVEEEVKQNRLNRVMSEARKISYNQNKKHIGEVMEGLVIGFDGKDYLLRSYFNAPDDVDGKIYFKSDKSHKMGDIVKVRITNAFVYDLMGEEI